MPFNLASGLEGKGVLVTGAAGGIGIAAIEIAKALGARVILLPFFGRGALRTHEEMDFVGDFLKEIGPEAEKTGVILGIEDTISAVDNLRILDRAKSPAVQVYDVGNSTGGGFDIIKEIRMLGRHRICEFHFKDNPKYLGEGRIDFPAVIDVRTSDSRDGRTSRPIPPLGT